MADTTRINDINPQTSLTDVFGHIVEMPGIRVPHGSIALTILFISLASS